MYRSLQLSFVPLYVILSACGSLYVQAPQPTFRAQVSATATPGQLEAGVEGDSTIEAWAEHSARAEGTTGLDVVAHGDADAPEVVIEGGGNGNSAVAVHGEVDEVREAAQLQTSRRVRAQPEGQSTGTGTATVDVSVASGPVSFDASAPGAAPPTTGRGPGVRGTAGGRAHFGALLEAGIDVDGTVVTLDQIGPLGLSASAEADGRFAGDGAIDAWATLEHDTLPRDGGETRMTVRIRGGGEAEARGPLDVHLVLDRSSSMQPSWREAVDAAKMLIERLAPTDRIHISAYGTRGEEVLTSRLVGDGRSAQRALDRIRVGGGTNIEAGLDIAYREVRRAPPSFRGRSLVILVSDGVPNEGELGAEGLATMARRARAGHACTTTVIGLGDQFDADVLSSIALDGRGGYYLARTARELAPALAAEIRAHANIAARDVRLSLDLGDGVSATGIFDGHAGAVQTESGVVLTLPKLATGEERRIVVRLRVESGARPRQVATARLDYRAQGRPRSARGEAWVGFGADARFAAGIGGVYALDGDLGEALVDAGRQVGYGNGLVASARLRAHVAAAESHPLHRSGQRMRRRTAAVGRLAIAIDALGEDASHRERREVGLALGALSVRFAR